MEEQTIFGVKACLALIERRPEDVLRIYHGKNIRGELGGILSWAASRRITYREVDDESLSKLAESRHHEGLAVKARPMRLKDVSREALAMARDKAEVWLALDDVSNPHNTGAILRTAAFFAVGAVMLGGTAPGEKLNSGALRTSEGGAEMLPLLGVSSMAETLGNLRGEALEVWGLETGVRETLFETASRRFASQPGVKNSPGPAVVLVLGHERKGLSPEVQKACSRLCSLTPPGGAGGMGSLNVSVSAAVALTTLSILRGTAG